MALWTLLYALGNSHARTEKGLAQTVLPQSWWYTTVIHKKYWYDAHLEFPSLELRGLGQPLKRSPIALSIIHQTLQPAKCSQAPGVLQT